MARLIILIMDVCLGANRLADVLEAVPDIPSLALNMVVASSWRDDSFSVISPR